MPRNSLAEVERRVTIVYELMVKGFTRPQIIEYCNKRAEQVGSDGLSWDVDIRTIDSYIAQARDLLKTKAATVRDEVFGRTLERREDLYQEARQHMDLKTALAIDQDTARLLDLYPEQKTRMSIEEVNPFRGLDMAQLLSMLEALDNPLKALDVVAKPAELEVLVANEVER